MYQCLHADAKLFLKEQEFFDLNKTALSTYFLKDTFPWGEECPPKSKCRSFLVDMFRNIENYVAKLMGKMGLKVRARSEMIARVRQAVEHITKVTGTNYVMLVKDGDDGPVCYIERPKARKTAVMAETAEVSWSELAERARALSNG